MIVTAASVAALQVGFKKNFQDAFTATRAQTAYARVATIIPSTSKAETYGWLGKFPKMREWVGSRQIEDMEGYGYTITNRKFEATVGVERTDIEDDNLGHYASLMASMGAEAATAPDRLTFGLLKAGQTTVGYDGQNFFDTDHPGFDATGAVATYSNIDTSGEVGAPFWYLMDTTKPLRGLIFQERQKPRFISKTNPETSDHLFMDDEIVHGVDARWNAGFGFHQFVYASNAPLTGDALDEAIARMRSQKDKHGDPMGIRPSMLVVGPQLRAAANKTVKVMLGEGGASNSNFEAVEVLDTDWVA